MYYLSKYQPVVKFLIIKLLEMKNLICHRNSCDKKIKKCYYKFIFLNELISSLTYKKQWIISKEKKIIGCANYHNSFKTIKSLFGNLFKFVSELIFLIVLPSFSFPTRSIF